MAYAIDGCMKTFKDIVFEIARETPPPELVELNGEILCVKCSCARDKEIYIKLKNGVFRCEDGWKCCQSFIRYWPEDKIGKSRSPIPQAG